MEFRGPGRTLEFRGPDGAMLLTPGTPLRIERLDGPRLRLRALPRKMQLRRGAPVRVESVTPFESDIIELDSEIMSDSESRRREVEVLSESLSDGDLLPSEDVEAIEAVELDVEPIET